jgi:hypothetical protein
MLMRSALFWGITQRLVLVLYRRFGTTYRSHLQGSRIPRRKVSFWNSWPLNMGPVPCSETSVRDYHSTLRNIPEERIFVYQRHSEQLESFRMPRCKECLWQVCVLRNRLHVAGLDLITSVNCNFDKSRVTKEWRREYRSVCCCGSVPILTRLLWRRRQRDGYC